MVLNPYFQQGATSEQNLIQDLVNEQLKIYGVEIYYLPRQYVTKTTVIREVIESKFTDAYPIEAYVDTYEGYEGVGTLLSKFGIQELDDLNLIISQERFSNYISPLIKSIPNIELSTRPKEGDLIYFPLGDRLFEIKYVEHEKPFYQLQKNYVYELRCELFRYEDEVIDTGVEEIDDSLIGDDYDGKTEDGLSTIVGPTQTLTLVGVGVTATAITGIIPSGGIRYVDITNRGGGYLSQPRVAISSAPSTGITGIGTVRLIHGIVACNDNVNSAAGSVQHVDLVNAGAGYTAAPEINFFGGGGSGAAATSVIGDNVIGIVTVQTGGSGYTTSPTISFTNEIFKSGLALTVGAAATAVVSAAGSITAINITNAGLGYSIAPTINIVGAGVTYTGDFKFNEIVKGITSGTEARVRTWDSGTTILEVASVDGTWVRGEKLVGQTSGAVHEIRQIDLDPTEDGFADNAEIETKADEILDFTEKNPFGTP